jgi:uncharacterized protein YegP (UPF0339 family)
MKLPYVVEVYQDTAAEWRWRLVAPNTHILASSDGYACRAHAVRAARRFHALCDGERVQLVCTGR